MLRHHYIKMLRAKASSFNERFQRKWLNQLQQRKYKTETKKDFSYIYIMKGKGKKAIKNKSLRAQILASMLASFRIEGIHIPLDQAEAALLKIELTLEK